MASCQKVPKFVFQSQFSVKNYLNLSQLFFIDEYVPIYEHIFCRWNFLIKSLLKKNILLKWCPFFDSSPIIQNSKLSNFLCVVWFLWKNLSTFIPPAWKRHNPYCHNDNCRFGIILSLTTTEFIKKDEECFVHYGYNLSTAPKWYQALHEKFVEKSLKKYIAKKSLSEL